MICLTLCISYRISVFSELNTKKLKGNNFNIYKVIKTDHIFFSKEILESVTILNLDTGEALPLSVAEDTIPNGINPLDLHIMHRTMEYHRYLYYIFYTYMYNKSNHS